MDDYIKRSEAKRALTGWDTDPTDEEIEYTLDKIPSANVVEVVDCEIRDTKHYVVASHWACDYEVGCTILGVGHSLEEAKSIFNMHVLEEKSNASEYGWTIYEDRDTVFDAGEEGYYAKDHTYVFIECINGD